MKRLFVSQPMNEKTDEEILQERIVAVEKAKVILDDDVELIDRGYIIAEQLKKQNN